MSLRQISHGLVAPLHAQDRGTAPGAVVAVAASTGLIIRVVAVLHVPRTLAHT